METDRFAPDIVEKVARLARLLADIRIHPFLGACLALKGGTALKRLRGTRTILLVAHRLSTVRDADRVIFIENGRVAGIDTFEGLCRRNEKFRQMAGVSAV